jgi:hypothetical protein
LFVHPAPIGPLLALDRPLLRGELELRLVHRRHELQDHQSLQDRSLLHGRNDNSRELGVVSDGGGGSGRSFVGHL